MIKTELRKHIIYIKKIYLKNFKKSFSFEITPYHE